MKMLIGGEWSEGSSGEWIEVDNPATGEIIDRVPNASVEDVRRAVDIANDARKTAEETPAYKRASLLQRVATLLQERSDTFARLISAEAGKPIRDAEIEVRRAIGVFVIAAEESKRLYGEVLPTDAYEYPAKSETRFAFSVREPIGVVVAIAPFNFPLNLMSHKVAPALAGGNVVIAKPTSETPLSAIKLGELITEAGCPPGVFNVVTGPGSTVGTELIENPKTNYITFTGSTAAGLQIAGKAARLGKKLTLEMGGMDPFIILDDADLNLAADAALRGCFSYAGQVCIASKRFLVIDSVADNFSKMLTERVSKLKVGNPLDRTTDIGPVINSEAVKRIHKIVIDAKGDGAQILIGGTPLTQGEFAKGSYYAPTVLDNVRPESSVAQDEPFAPLAPILRTRSYDEAIEIANSTIYGLQASIFTRNVGRALKLARRIRAGAVLIDDPTNIRWDNMPFGGVKKSGMGREGVRYAIHEMTESKLISVNLANF